MDTDANNNKDAKSITLINMLDNFFSDIYIIYLFILRFFKEAFIPPYNFKEITKQCYNIGYKSLPIITLTGFVVGIVFTKQSRPSLADFGATSWLPSLMAIAVIRALAPLVTSLIMAGKIGSNIGAELGSMNVTEQIDAMEVSGTNPFKFLVVSRVIATTFMVPMLVIYSAFVGLMGAYLNIHQNELTSFKAFMMQVFSKISFLDIFSSLTKAIVYGFTIAIVGCYKGYTTKGGTVGVGRSANGAVVTSMFLIFMEEMIIVQITTYLR